MKNRDIQAVAMQLGKVNSALQILESINWDNGLESVDHIRQVKKAQASLRKAANELFGHHWQVFIDCRREETDQKKGESYED